MPTPEVGPKPATLYLRVKQGIPFAKVLTWSRAGVPISLVGSTFAAQVQIKEGEVVAFLCQLTAQDATLATNQLRLKLTAEQTAAMRKGDYYWDLDWTDAAGTPTTPIDGRVTVTKQVAGT